MPLRWDPWNEVAVALDGTVRIKTKLASSEISLTLPFDDVTVTAVGKSVPYGGRDHTRVTAKSPGTPELHVVIAHPEETRAGRLHRVTVSDRALDRRKAVFANDPGLARTWLDDEIRASIADCPYRVELDDGHVHAHVPRLEDDADRLEAVIRTVAHVASRGTGLRRAWMAMAEDAIVVGSTANRGRLAKLPALQMKHGGATVDISPFYGALGKRRHGKRFFTRLEAERRAHTLDEYVIHPTFAERALKPRVGRRLDPLEPSPLDRWSFECEDEARMRARVAKPIPELLERSGVAVIRATRRRVSVNVPGLLVDQSQLRAALALTAKLAVEIETEAAGPYR